MLSGVALAGSKRWHHLRIPLGFRVQALILLPQRVDAAVQGVDHRVAFVHQGFQWSLRDWSEECRYWRALAAELDQTKPVWEIRGANRALWPASCQNLVGFGEEFAGLGQRFQCSRH